MGEDTGWLNYLGYMESLQGNYVTTTSIPLDFITINIPEEGSEKDEPELANLEEFLNELW